MLAYNRKHIKNLGSPSQTQFILAQPNTPFLQSGSVDLVFLCNVYHHLEHSTEYMTKAKSALKPRGRVTIIDFYHDERSGKLGFSKHHLVPREMVVKEMQQAGFILLKEHTFLPRQYFLEFAVSE